MLRRIIIFVGLAIMGVGVWALIHERTQQAACPSTGASISQSGITVSGTCLSSVMSYFLGFVLIAGGLLVIAIAIMLMEKLPLNRKEMKEASSDFPYTYEPLGPPPGYRPGQRAKAPEEEPRNESPDTSEP